MHKEYKHPSPYRPDYNYLEGMHAADKHIKDITKNGTHPGQAQHLGGMASYRNQLKDYHYGPGESIKKDLKRVLDYLFYYSKTDHDIYHFLAEDALMHMDQMVSDIQDPKEKEHIRYFVECVREYMHWLKVNKPRDREQEYGEYEEYEEYNDDIVGEGGMSSRGSSGSRSGGNRSSQSGSQNRGGGGNRSSERAGGYRSGGNRSSQSGSQNRGGGGGYRSSERGGDNRSESSRMSQQRNDGIFGDGGDYRPFDNLEMNRQYGQNPQNPQYRNESPYYNENRNMNKSYDPNNPYYNENQNMNKPYDPNNPNYNENPNTTPNTNPNIATPPKGIVNL